MPLPSARALPKYEAVRSHINGERMYATSDGSFYSVTTILSGTNDPLPIMQWRESIGEKAADRILRVACARGDATHLNIENWLLTGTEPNLNLLTSPYWKSVYPWLLGNISKTLLCEGAVWHPDGYAGTADCVACINEYGDEPILLDWKTADKPKAEGRLYDYSLQCAAYRNALNYVYKPLGLQINRAKIVIAIADATCQVKTLEADELDQLYSHFKARLIRFTRSR